MALTDFYHRFPTGQIRRIPLCPLVCIDALAVAFSELRETLSRVDDDQSYVSLWGDSPKFRRQVSEILTLNGMGGDLPLGDLVSLCIGSDRPPLLAQYNFLSEDFTPQPKGAIADEEGDLSPSPRPQAKKMAEVFPLFDTGGALVYPHGVMSADHGEFEAVYGKLTAELQEIGSAWSLCHPAIALLWSEEVKVLALRLVEIFGLPPTRLNIHQVCELAIAYQDEPGLLPQLGGLIEVEQEETKDGPPMPKTHSAIHFVIGALGQAGVKDWRSLIEGMTFHELESYQQGLIWAADGGESERKKRNKAHRHDVFNRRIVEGKADGVLESLQQRRRKSGRGIGL